MIKQYFNLWFCAYVVVKSSSETPEETIAVEKTEETDEKDTTATGKVRLKCNHCEKTFSNKQSKSMHIKVNCLILKFDVNFNVMNETLDSKVVHYMERNIPIF